MTSRSAERYVCYAVHGVCTAAAHARYVQTREPCACTCTNAATWQVVSVRYGV